MRYYARLQTARGGWAATPSWARGIVLLLAVPGVLAVALSFLLLCVSVLALLLLTVPAYRFLQAVTGTRPAAPARPAENPLAALFAGSAAGSGRRRVDATVTDAEPTPD